MLATAHCLGLAGLESQVVDVVQCHAVFVEEMVVREGSEDCARRTFYFEFRSLRWSRSVDVGDREVVAEFDVRCPRVLVRD